MLCSNNIFCSLQLINYSPYLKMSTKFSTPPNAHRCECVLMWWFVPSVFFSSSIQRCIHISKCSRMAGDTHMNTRITFAKQNQIPNASFSKNSFIPIWMCGNGFLKIIRFCVFFVYFRLDINKCWRTCWNLLLYTCVKKRIIKNDESKNHRRKHVCECVCMVGINEFHC